MKRCILLLLIWGWMAGVASAEVIPEKAWVRQPPPVADTAAGYMTLRNDGDRPVEIVSIDSDVSAVAEIHTMRMQGGMMHMQHLPKMTIAAHGTLELSPGGMHLMLIGLKHPLRDGQQVHITLHFADGSQLKVQAKVRDMRHGHGGMH
ncbi:MAG: copper chaperone PCu(A)C [Mariprofundaceae bacterium]|nr:copper chaperone PCu(A)C [Mariprofundaceae bacterium]